MNINNKLQVKPPTLNAGAAVPRRMASSINAYSPGGIPGRGLSWGPTWLGASWGLPSWRPPGSSWLRFPWGWRPPGGSLGLLGGRGPHFLWFPMISYHFL